MAQDGISKKCYLLSFILLNINPMKGSSFIPLPDFIMRKKAIINLKNRNDRKWYLHQCNNRHSDEVTDLKQYENELSFKGIDFSVKLKDITKFESQSPNLPGINVFSINEQKKIYPLRLNEKDCQNSIDLCLYEEDRKSHYSFIKDFSRLTSERVSKNTSVKKYYCKKCLSHFIKEELFKKTH